MSDEKPAVQYGLLGVDAYAPVKYGEVMHSLITPQTPYCPWSFKALQLAVSTAVCEDVWMFPSIAASAGLVHALYVELW